jgi:hypothetical protein
MADKEQRTYEQLRQTAQSANKEADKKIVEIQREQRAQETIGETLRREQRGQRK